MTEPSAGQRVPRWAGVALIAAAVLLTIADWTRAVRLADTLPYFVDEIVNTEAAVGLFRTGNYASSRIGGVFPPAVSSGPVATWPSALPFLVGNGSLFDARVCLAAWWWLAGFSLVFAYLRRQGAGTPLSLACAALAWSTVYLVPYAQGHVQNLGELGGAIILGWGALLVRNRPFVGGAALGAAVVGCKLIYLPATLAIAGAEVVRASREADRQGAGRAPVAALALGLVAPLVALQLWIAVGFGPAHVLTWWREYASFVVQGGSGLADGSSLPLADRLRTLEWHTYEGVVRRRIGLWTLGAVGAGLAAIALRRRLALSSASVATIAALSAVICAYLAWYLLWSPFMYIRHIQPAMWIGLAVWLVVGWQALAALASRRRVWPVLAVLLLALSARHLATSAREGPVIAPSPSYARQCFEPLSALSATPEATR